MNIELLRLLRKHPDIGATDATLCEAAAKIISRETLDDEMRIIARLFKIFECEKRLFRDSYIRDCLIAWIKVSRGS